MATEQIPTSIIADDAVTGDKIENNPTVAGNLSVGGTAAVTGTLTVSGNTTLSGTNNLGSNPTVTLGTNTTVNTQDYFLAKMDGDQTISDNTWSSVEFDLDVHDPNSWFNTSTYKFQPSKAGKYYVYAMVGINSGGNSQIYLNQLAIGKNTTTVTDSSPVAYYHYDFRNHRISDNTPQCFNIIDMNGSSDYLHVRTHCYAGTSSTVQSAYCHFGAFRIGA